MTKHQREVLFSPEDQDEELYIIICRKIFLTNHFLLLSWWIFCLFVFHICVSVAHKCSSVLHVTCFSLGYLGEDGRRKTSKFRMPTAIIDKDCCIMGMIVKMCTYLYLLPISYKDLKNGSMLCRLSSTFSIS